MCDVRDIRRMNKMVKAKIRVRNDIMVALRKQAEEFKKTGKSKSIKIGKLEVIGSFTKSNKCKK